MFFKSFRIYKQVRCSTSGQQGYTLLVVLFIGLVLSISPTRVSAGFQGIEHQIEPGDTWLALSLRYNLKESLLKMSNASINQQRQPVIGTVLTIPVDAKSELTGRMVTVYKGGLLQVAIKYDTSPWLLAIKNDLYHPVRPLLYRPILIPDADAQIRQLPYGIDELELSQLVAQPGEALAIRASGLDSESVNVLFAGKPIKTTIKQGRLIGLFGTGAFFEPGHHNLTIETGNAPLWSQPWLFEPGTWSFEDITLTGSAAEIDSQSIRDEYERLAQLWAVSSPEPQWDSEFQYPIENFLSVSSLYGTRRSYNGGPYSSYHEGLDFSAYGGTPVFAVARGTVVLAEDLYVRGGAVIIDHGLGVYSGAYHLNETSVEPGQLVEQGQQIGQVGSTGLSTGNHLHWDFLVNGTWVNPAAWNESGIDSWILDWWQGTPEDS